jgi:hypothetical protein
MKASASTTTNRISTFVLLIVLIVMALSLVALGLAVDSFVRGYQLQAMYMLAIGFIAMGLSSYLLLQSRRRGTAMKTETPATMTTIECRKCGFKSVREFQRGDYVFKELEMCQKCDDRQIITSIYREIKEKEKTFPF